MRTLGVERLVLDVGRRLQVGLYAFSVLVNSYGLVPQRVRPVAKTASVGGARPALLRPS